MPSEQEAETAVSAGQPQGSRRHERVQTGVLMAALGAAAGVSYAAVAVAVSTVAPALFAFLAALLAFVVVFTAGEAALVRAVTAVAGGDK